MDKKEIIGKLNAVFCDLIKTGKTYSEVWLEYATFGGLYCSSGMYILHVKAHHRVDNLFSEIMDILTMLNEKATDVYNYIWRVAVHNTDSRIHCECDDIKVFAEESSYQ